MQPLMAGAKGRIDPRVALCAVAVAALVAAQLVLLYLVATDERCAGLEQGNVVALEEFDRLANSERRARWEYWPYSDSSLPERPRIGLISGGSSDLYGGSDGSYGDATACLLRLLAQRKGYALYIERALQRLGGDRPVAWQKIKLLRERLDDVDLVVWIDADIAWTDRDANLEDLFLHRLSKPEACTQNLGQPRFDNDAGMADSGSLFFWVSADVRPKPKGNMNMNSAVMALRGRSQDSRRFLNEIWELGNDPMSFTKHNPGWKKQPPGHHYWGWPFEQGAVWEILDRDRELLRRTCVTAVGALHSVQYHRWVAGATPGAHMPGMSDLDRRRAACRHLSEEELPSAERCGQALRLCPDLFAGRLLAAHADGLCAHCWSNASVEEKSAAGDWQAFDCGCIHPTK